MIVHIFGIEPTVYNVAFLDLLKDLRPNIGMALLVCCNS